MRLDCALKMLMPLLNLYYVTIPWKIRKPLKENNLTQNSHLGAFAQLPSAFWKEKTHGPTLGCRGPSLRFGEEPHPMSVGMPAKG